MIYAMAKVTVTLRVTVLQHFTGGTSIEEAYRRAGAEAIGHVKTMVERYGNGIEIGGEDPKVDLVMVDGAP